MWSTSSWGMTEKDKDLIFALDHDARVPAADRVGIPGQTDRLFLDVARREIVGVALQRVRAIIDAVAQDGQSIDFDTASDLLTVAERLLGLAERAASPTLTRDK